MAVTWTPLAVVVVAVMVAKPDVTGTVLQGSFIKTVGSRYDTRCFLGSSFTPYGPRSLLSLTQNCGLQCLKTTDCRFYCVNAVTGSCLFFSTYVARRWAGDATGTTYTACYTSWGHGRDVIQLNTTITYSSNLAGYLVSYGIDGCACNPACSYTTTQPLANSWWQFDLGVVPIKVQRLVVATEYAAEFRNVSVYLGNFSSAYTNNPLVATFGGPPSDWTTVTVEVNVNSLPGRYLTIMSPNNWYFGFCEMQIIRA